MSHNMTKLLVGLLVGGFAAPQPVRADGAVYAMTNALEYNEIVVYHRHSDGTLTHIQTIATGGGGSGIQLDPTDSLGSQGSLVLDQAHHRLFAVNTQTEAEDTVDGTDVSDCRQGTISSFLVGDDGSLTLVDSIPSGGLFPASLAVSGDRLYVLNAGGPGVTPPTTCRSGPNMIGPNITGFQVGPDAEMSLLDGATQPIDPGPSPGSFLNCDPGGFPAEEFECGLNPPAFPRSPAQVGFTPDNRALVVTVKGTNSLYVFPLDEDGKPGNPTITQVGDPNQPTPFGFAFDGNGHLIVAEPFGATPVIPAGEASAVSSFALTDNGGLQAISSSVPNGQTASCWIALDPSKRYAYVSNNGSSTISSYRIGNDGSLKLLAPDATTAVHLPNDLAVVRDSDNRRSFLYVVNSGNGTVGAFQISNGSLSLIEEAAGLPSDAGAQGLAAY